MGANDWTVTRRYRAEFFNSYDGSNIRIIGATAAETAKYFGPSIREG